ncbi:WGxxGxxG family protein [Rubrobacter marinus]|uniref:WGxxGxxG family protein n=1 Tax=Rubrobacter marinus TaxID=2653852 RepID=UPI001408295D|nr:WGxxGxxG family protein [Rubrobacter marinus]
MLLESARTITQKKLAAAALAGLLSAGALTAAGQAAEAQSQGEGEVVNRDVVVNEDRDYTGLWGLLGLLGLAGLAGLRRRKDDNVDVKRAPSAERNSGTRNVTSADDGDGVRRGTVRDSEVVSSTDGSVDGDKVDVHRKR